MSRISPQWVGVGVGIALVALIIGVEIRIHSEPRVTIGKNDEVYYYRRATKEDALTLGEALQKIGYLTDRGTSVLLWIGGGPTIVSFVTNQGAWEHPHVISNFTEIGRRVATSVGGFPIQVHLIDAGRNIRRKMTVGKTMIGTKDIVYYFGDATLADAKGLGEALRSAGYFADRGATVAILKGEGTAISFVVQEGLWDNPAALATLDKLVRQIAPAVGGLPIELRMLDRAMTIKQTLTIS
jgi:hypothetical protein